MKPPLGVANVWNLGNKRYETHEIKKSMKHMKYKIYFIHMNKKSFIFTQRCGLSFAFLNFIYEIILTSVSFHCRPDPQKQRVRVFFSRRAFGATREKNSYPLFMRSVPTCALRAEFFNDNWILWSLNEKKQKLRKGFNEFFVKKFKPKIFSTERLWFFLHFWS